MARDMFVVCEDDLVAWMPANYNIVLIELVLLGAVFAREFIDRAAVLVGSEHFLCFFQQRSRIETTLRAVHANRRVQKLPTALSATGILEIADLRKFRFHFLHDGSVE